MALTVEDLRAKDFIIKIKDVELQCKPLKLSHALTVSKLGEIFQNTKNVTKQEVKQAEADMDEIIKELIPELAGVELDLGTTLEVITGMMENVQPSDNKELSDNKVKIDTDPKVEKIG